MAGLPPLILTIQARSQGVTNTLGGIARSVRDAGDALEQARKRTEELEQAIADARASGDMQKLTEASAELQNHLNSGAHAAGQLGARMETAQRWGAGISAAGVAGLALANSLADASKEGTALDTRLQSILRTQGRLKDLGAIEGIVNQTTETGGFASSTGIKNAATFLASVKVETADIIKLLPRLAALSRSTGQEVEEMAENLAEGYRNISLEDVEELGLYLGDAAKKELDDLKESSGAAAARTRWLALVLAEADSQAGNLADSISDTERAANEAARAQGDLTSAIGRGAAEARKSFTELLGGVLQVAGANEEAAEGAGKWLVWGSSFALVLGGLLTVGASVVQTLAGLAALGVNMSALWATIAGGAAAAAAAIGLVITAIGGLWVAWQGSKDASSMSDEALIKKWGPMGNLWVGLSNSAVDSGPTEEDRATYEAAKKAGVTKGKTFEEWRGSSIDTSPSVDVDPVAKAKAEVDAAMKDAESKIRVATSGGVSVGGGVNLSTPGSLLADMNAREDAAAKADKAKETKEKKEKELEDARKKADEKLKRDLERMGEAEDEIRAARIEEAYNVEIARLEASATDEESARTAWQRAMLEADRTEHLGGLRNKNEDDIAFSKRSQLAQIRAQGMRERARLAYDKEAREEAAQASRGNTLGAALAAGRLRASYDLSPSARMARAAVAGQTFSAGATGMQAVREERFRPQLRAEVVNVLREAFGNLDTLIRLSIDDGTAQLTRELQGYRP